MTNHLLDNRMIISNLFFPRNAIPHTHPDKERVRDGTITLSDGTNIGWRCYRLNHSAPVLLYFHGNGEVASDYDDLATYYHGTGVSLLVVDYRGYGWSTGTPLTSRLLPDADEVFQQRAHILQQCAIDADVVCFVKGRSLGSAPAIYLALQHPQAIRGLIIESGYASAPSLFRRLGIPIPDIAIHDDHMPISNVEKMKRIFIPLLVIHGEMDTLIPVQNGIELYNASPASSKTLVTIPRAGHNDILYVGMTRYFSAIKQLIEAHSR